MRRLPFPSAAAPAFTDAARLCMPDRRAEAAE